MGTDIHGVFQRRTSDGWEDVETEFKFNRHYQLFAVLAGVRNGFGFAGVPTGEPVTPLAPPRGLPPDFTMDDDRHPVASYDLLDPLTKKYGDGPGKEPLEVWMGDHSYSWLLGDEMLRWCREAPSVKQCGVISRAEFERWDRKRPESYSGDVSGRGIIVVEQEEAEGVLKDSKDWTHVRVYWQQSLADELVYFFDEVQRLVSEHHDIRFVFGFDS